tara:strand:+ start:130 stop:1104 length:975 start_codon:yes stop_codon:yes gene_type:complete
MIQNFVISRTPLRISFVGGGSDLPSFYKKSKYGCVISTTIDKYIYLILHQRHDKLIRASYSKTEIVDDVNKLNHELIRESLLKFNIKDSIEVVSISDVTGQGTGLGSSSSYTIGLLNALSSLNKQKYSKYNLAELACEIEIDKCEKPIGKQDQYATSFGGFNQIEFYEDIVQIKPIQIPQENLIKLENRLLLFDMNISRKSSDILKEQDNLYNDNKISMTQEMVKLTKPFKNALINNIDEIGYIMNESWEIKKQLTSKITNPKIEDIYNLAMSCGADGAKVCGAGGGGFLLIYVKEENKEHLRSTMKEYKELKFGFDYEGTSIV